MSLGRLILVPTRCEREGLRRAAVRFRRYLARAAVWTVYGGDARRWTLAVRLVSAEICGLSGAWTCEALRDQGDQQRALHTAGGVNLQRANDIRVRASNSLIRAQPEGNRAKILCLLLCK